LGEYDAILDIVGSPGMKLKFVCDEIGIPGFDDLE
jgi:hypothetical protein